jgi:formate dehydrogenase major subunit
MTGRVLYQYHTRTMSGKSEGLNKIAGSSYIEISSTDAERLGIDDQEKVKVSSRRGEITARARIVANKVAPGVVFIPFHFVDGAANTLTNPVFDDMAKIPEFKACACKVERIKT